MQRLGNKSAGYTILTLAMLFSAAVPKASHAEDAIQASVDFQSGEDHRLGRSSEEKREDGTYKHFLRLSAEGEARGNDRERRMDGDSAELRAARVNLVTLQRQYDYAKQDFEKAAGQSDVETNGMGPFQKFGKWIGLNDTPALKNAESAKKALNRARDALNDIHEKIARLEKDAEKISSRSQSYVDESEAWRRRVIRETSESGYGSGGYVRIGGGGGSGQMSPCEAARRGLAGAGGCSATQWRNSQLATQIRANAGDDCIRARQMQMESYMFLSKLDWVKTKAQLDDNNMRELRRRMDEELRGSEIGAFIHDETCKNIDRCVTEGIPGLNRQVNPAPAAATCVPAALPLPLPPPPPAPPSDPAISTSGAPAGLPRSWAKSP